MIRSSAMLLLVSAMTLGLVVPAACGEIGKPSKESIEMASTVSEIQEMAKKLLSDSDELSPDDIYSLLKQLAQATEKKIDISRSFPYDVEKLLSLRTDIGCLGSSEVQFDISEFWNQSYIMAKEGHRQLHNYVSDCFRKYLEECGFEKRYQQEVTYARLHWPYQDDLGNLDDLNKYSSLFDYLTRGSSESFGHEDLMDFFQLNQALELVNDIWQYENLIKENCNDSDEFLKEIVERAMRTRRTRRTRKLMYPELYKLVDAYFAEYLEICGLEASFNQVLGSDGTAKGAHNFALHNYLMGEFLQQVKMTNRKYMHDIADYVDEILFALRLVGRLTKLSQIGESDCNDVTITDELIEFDEHTSRMEFSKLQKFVKDILTRHQNDCQNYFKKRAKNFAHEKESWNFIEDLVERCEKVILGPVSRPVDKSDISEAVKDAKSMMEKDGIELESHCGAYIDDVWPTTYGFCAENPTINESRAVAILDDKDITKHLVSLEICMQLNQNESYDKCDGLFKKFHAYAYVEAVKSYVQN